MSLTPTRDDTCVKVTYVKSAGGAAEMPNTITVYVEALPLLRGVCRKVLHTPFFNSLNTQAVSTSYTPDPATTIDLIGRYRIVVVPMVRGSGTVAGVISTDVNSARLTFTPTALSDTIVEGRIEVETLKY